MKHSSYATPASTIGRRRESLIDMMSRTTRILLVGLWQTSHLRGPSSIKCAQIHSNSLDYGELAILKSVLNGLEKAVPVTRTLTRTWE